MAQNAHLSLLSNTNQGFSTAFDGWAETKPKNTHFLGLLPLFGPMRRIYPNVIDQKQPNEVTTLVLDR
jgi:hypothetical protein